MLEVPDADDRFEERLGNFVEQARDEAEGAKGPSTFMVGAGPIVQRDRRLDDLADELGR